MEACRTVNVGRRISRERKTIAAMIEMYCRGKHGGTRRRSARGGLCAECAALLEYAKRRLDRCRFGEEKPTCGRCPAHCYRPVEKADIIDVMRYSGPRMIVRHPVLAIRHLRDAMEDGKRTGGRKRS